MKSIEAKTVKQQKELHDALSQMFFWTNKKAKVRPPPQKKAVVP